MTAQICVQIFVVSGICPPLDRLSSAVRRRFFNNFMSGKLRYADAIEMGIEKHMIASLCRLGNNAISMSLVRNSFGCLIRS